MSAPPDRRSTADHGPRTGRTRFAARLRGRLATASQTRLWTVALLALVLDVALTAAGLRVGLVEANPVATATMRVLGVFGGLVALKSLAVAVALVGHAALPREYRSVAPLALAVPWWIAVAVNVTVIASVL